jgi:hypothetical protein
MRGSSLANEILAKNTFGEGLKEQPRSAMATIKELTLRSLYPVNHTVGRFAWDLDKEKNARTTKTSNVSLKATVDSLSKYSLTLHSL